LSREERVVSESRARDRARGQGWERPWRAGPRGGWDKEGSRWQMPTNWTLMSSDGVVSAPDQDLSHMRPAARPSELPDGARSSPAMATAHRHGHRDYIGCDCFIPTTPRFSSSSIHDVDPASSVCTMTKGAHLCCTLLFFYAHSTSTTPCSTRVPLTDVGAGGCIRGEKTQERGCMYAMSVNQVVYTPYHVTYVVDSHDATAGELLKWKNY
jgi:hypothetical protein